MPQTPSATPPADVSARLPLRGWALEFARRWNAGTYSLFVLHGNIFDLFPVAEREGIAFVPLKAFLARRLFPAREFLLFYDIGDGLTFGTPEMQKRFFEWLEVYDQVEKTSYREQGPPRDFLRLAPLLRRFFLRVGEDKQWNGITLIVDYPEKIVPAAEEAGAMMDERMALVTLLKWASSPELRRLDIGVILATESAAELHGDLLQNPYVAQVRIDLPDAPDRALFLETEVARRLAGGRPAEQWSELPLPDLAQRTAGLNLVRLQHLAAEAIRNESRLSLDHLSRGKKRLIEEYCQGLVRFKEPKPGLNLDAVAVHHAA
ncbi:MAG TPA: AAA family ATPase, partial [Methylomirabilota bacterium]|nr:AAA family ATPase [Methylomirabilota bacterium]